METPNWAQTTISATIIMDDCGAGFASFALSEAR